MALCSCRYWAALLACTAAFAIGPFAIAAASPSRAEVATPSRNVAAGVLANGFRYIVDDGIVGDRKITLQLTVRTGSNDDPAGMSGLAHLLEHLPYQGTRRFPGNALRLALERNSESGGRYSFRTRGSSTVYALTVSRADLGLGLDLLREIASDLAITDEGVAREKAAVASEMSSGGLETIRDIYRVSDALLGTDQASKLSNVSAELESISASSIRAFYKEHYVADKMTLVVVGDVGSDDFAKDLGRVFERIGRSRASHGGKHAQHVSKGPPGQRAAWNAPAFQHLNIGSNRENRGEQRIRLYSAVGRPFKSQIGEPSFWHSQILRLLIDYMIQRRTEEQPFIFERRILVNDDTKEIVEQFSGNAVVAEQHPLPKIVTIMAMSLRQLNKYGFSRAELDNAKRSVLASLSNSNDSNDNLAGSYADAEELWGEFESPLSPTDLASAIAAVDLTEINRLMAELTDPGEGYRVISLSSEPSLNAQEAETTVHALDIAMTLPVKPFIARMIPKQLTSPVQNRKSSERELKPLGHGVWETILPNGMRLLLKQEGEKKGPWSTLSMLQAPGTAPLVVQGLPSGQLWSLQVPFYMVPKGLGKAEAKSYYRSRQLASAVKAGGSGTTLEWSGPTGSDATDLFDAARATLDNLNTPEFERDTAGFLALGRTAATGCGLTSQSFDLDQGSASLAALAQLQAFVPRTIMYVGPADPRNVVELAQTYLGDIPQQSNPTKPSGIAVASRPAGPAHPDIASVQDDIMTTICIASQGSEVPLDEARISLLMNVLSDLQWKTLRDDAGLYRFGNDIRSFSREAAAPGGRFVAYMFNSPRARSAEIGERALATLRDLGSTGITSEQLEKARRRLEGGSGLSSSTPVDLMMKFARGQSVSWQPADEAAANLTLEDMNDFVRNTVGKATITIERW